MAALTVLEFLGRLKEGSLGNPEHLEMVGVVKLDGSGQLLFSASTDCANWVAMASDDIDTVQHLGTLKCGGHGHPFVRITLKASEGGSAARDRAGRLAEEARRMEATLAPIATITDGPSASLHGRCIVFQGMEGLYVCCPPASGAGGGWVCTGMV